MSHQGNSRLDIRKNFLTRTPVGARVKHWNKLPRKWWSLDRWRYFEGPTDLTSTLGKCFSGGLGSAGLIAGFDDLKNVL